MQKIKSIFFIIFVFAIIFVYFKTYGTNNANNDENVKNKVVQELEYLDSQITSIVNKLNNISMQNYTISSEEVSLGEENTNGTSSSQSGNEPSGGSGVSGGEKKESGSQSSAGEESEKANITSTQMEPKTVLDSNENDIDWKSIKSQIETINEAWTVVFLDLSSLNINNNDLLEFSSTLDDCIISIKDENKVEALINIAKLYSYIPEFERGISSENSTQNIKKVKSYIINAYSVVEQGDWKTIEINLIEAEKTFKNITNDIEYMKNKEYKINRTYVLIKKLQNALPHRDRKLFYVKYKDLMDSINTL